ncbi:hypothetical protein BJ508DRAFT_45492 [Ascobolus immersus RN42]|uniref:C2H2-type domain-containing protein n=1 Tax=Ascobolus immersus RN42 TaxID=1160509 RepID=A0A3N4HNT3_ASCIM|nr:hypothetical protein BJ508DRAFT_45492 [Ascobolus immersus RN42]
MVLPECLQTITVRDAIAAAPNSNHVCRECYTPFSTSSLLARHRYTVHERTGVIQLRRLEVQLKRDQADLSFWCPMRGCRFSCKEEDVMQAHCNEHAAGFKSIKQFWPSNFMFGGSWWVDGCKLCMFLPLAFEVVRVNSLTIF